MMIIDADRENVRCTLSDGLRSILHIFERDSCRFGIQRVCQLGTFVCSDTLFEDDQCH